MPYYKSLAGEVYFLDSEDFIHLLPADVEPITEEEADILRKPTLSDIQNMRNEDARAYLSSTDWYVIRYLESGTPIPDGVSKARADARASIVE